MSSVDRTGHVKTDKSYNQNNRIRLDKLKAEPKVKVWGNTLYKDFLGDVYTFLYQDYPVTIKFDGTWQEYPETIATILTKKLDAAADANTFRDIGAGDRL